MDIRLTNLTGRSLYYKVLDYEGPYARFDEDSLPGMYPNGQSNYTDSDVYLENLNTKVGNQRYTLSSRYPKFNAPQDYMMNFSTGQKPSHRSYNELSHNYPPQVLNGKQLDGNYEGIIPIGKHRDLMLKDLNCNMYFRTIGPPKKSKMNTDDNYSYINGAPEIYGHVGGGFHGIHDKLNYDATIKAARLRENSVMLVLQYDNQYHMFNETGQEIKVDYPYDSTVIPLIAQVPFSIRAPNVIGSAPNTSSNNIGSAYNYSNERFTKTNAIARSRNYPYASVNTEPAINGTYIDSLYNESVNRKKSYGSKYVNMTNSNYSDDYDLPLLGYFDRRFLYRQPPGYLHQ